MSEYHVIGLMSGSSLDGLDVCVSKFRFINDRWTYTIIHTETISIPKSLIDKLRGSERLNPQELGLLDEEYGTWIGKQLSGIITKTQLQVDLIGVHGHTVFHDPTHQKLSVQIGNGEKIMAATGVAVVDNFRMKDIILGGQGAPLVPAGEHYLYPEHAAFLNLGGICNISIHQEDSIMAWDIAPCNQVLNHFANQLGLSYDAGGQLSCQGEIDQKWFNYLSSLDYFLKKPPKSLANQWTRVVLENAPNIPENGLATYVHFLSIEIAQSIKKNGKFNSIMITGGGAYNATLIDKLNYQLNGKVKLLIPEPEIIDYKEALIFGFLGLLRKLNIANVFASATGAQQDSVSGDLHSVI